MHVLDQNWFNVKFGFVSVIANINNKIWFYSVSDIVILVLVDHEQFLHLKISSGLFPTDIFLTIVYAKCSRTLRRVLWECLLECKPLDESPWVVGGYFNIIVDHFDCSLGVVNQPGGMLEFNDFIVSVGLADAGFVGLRFTWMNKRIRKRLDRVFLSPSWANFFNSFKVEHLHRGSSDHCPLNISDPFLPKSMGSFRFQNMWFFHPDFMQSVCLNLNNPCVKRGLSRLVIKLKRLKYHLKWWNQEVFGNILDKVKKLDVAVAQAKEMFDLVQSEENRVTLSLAQANPSLCISMEEAFWKQKALAKWIWEDGVALDSPSLISESGVRFFEQLLTGTPLPRSVTATTLIIIPKTEYAQRWSNFRPISLCNVIDKIITKIITIRLSRILPKIISISQSGFVAGRLISDNILLDQEMVNHLNYLIRGGNVCMNLHMAKAYGRVLWVFFLQMLRAFGFSEVFCWMILWYVNNCWFSININGSLSGFFASRRGIRQGDPLSPLFFNIAADYLSRGLETLFERNKSLQFRTGRPFRLSHLAYADYLIIFSNGSIRFGTWALRFFWVIGKAPISIISLLMPLRSCKGGSRKFIPLVAGWTALPAGLQPVQKMSTTWRRMMKVRNRAEPKIGWRIGDGNISFWFDYWLLDGPLSSLIPIQGKSSRLVSWFMTDRSWNLNRILMVVSHDVAFRIMFVPIHSSFKDIVIWKNSKTGRFSVKSAWGISLASSCQCFRDQESFEHLFFSSDTASSVWKLFATRFQVQNFLNFSSWKVAGTWRRGGNVRELMLFLIIWFLWKARNDHKHRGVHIQSARIIVLIHEFILSIGRAGVLRAGHWKGCVDVAISMGLESRLTRTIQVWVIWWLRPNFGHFKLNSDGCSKGGGESGIGGIIKDHLGNPILSYHDSIGVGTNTRAELCAILKGLQLCKLYNLFPLWLEVDSMVALSIIDVDYTSWELSNIQTQIQQMILFSMVTKSHIYREANVVADELANIRLVKGAATLLLEDIHGRLKGILRLDRSGLPYIRVKSSF
ncbi:uncharacterized protein [Henckelia pumila]|uniref:uncharacterized protein n=1 Tax=Henckelia pumila TaxID=405737 RepID=UPI003C6E1B3F